MQIIKPKARQSDVFMPMLGARWVVECGKHSALGTTLDEAYDKWKTKFIESQIERKTHVQ